MSRSNVSTHNAWANESAGWLLHSAEHGKRGGPAVIHRIRIRIRLQGYACYGYQGYAHRGHSMPRLGIPAPYDPLPTTTFTFGLLVWSDHIKY